MPRDEGGAVAMICWKTPGCRARCIACDERRLTVSGGNNESDRATCVPPVRTRGGGIVIADHNAEVIETRAVSLREATHRMARVLLPPITTIPGAWPKRTH
jgi:hypothetical protein